MASTVGANQLPPAQDEGHAVGEREGSRGRRQVDVAGHRAGARGRGDGVTADGAGRRQPHRRVHDSVVQMTEIVLPEDTNAEGSIFGGRVLALIDKCAAIVAMLSGNEEKSKSRTS